MDFKEKVQSMSSDEIIMAMVEGLRNPMVNINMDTYGSVLTSSSFLGLFKKQTCYGCAATNAVCQISGVKLDVNSIDTEFKRSRAIDSPSGFLHSFEFAINELRKGRIDLYNCYAEDCGFAKIKNKGFILPYLETDFIEDELNSYVDLAELEKKSND